MKISVICASRGRPVSMIAAVKSLSMLESNGHEVSYGIVCDDDDDLTLQAAWLLQSDMDREVRIFRDARDVVPRRVNKAALEMPADIYLPWADDCFSLSPLWDEIMVRLSERVPAFSWQEYADPQNVTMLAMTKRWVDSVGYLLCEYFPFWMSDTWIQEQYAFATAQPIGIVRQLQFAGRRGKTKQLNDVRFWFEFFASKRQERIAEGKKLRADLGFEHVEDASMQGFIEAFEARDQGQIDASPRYEECFHSGEPKSAAYETAYLQAQAFMDKLKLEKAA